MWIYRAVAIFIALFKKDQYPQHMASWLKDNDVDKCRRPEWHDGPCGEITQDDIDEMR